jgi:membrane glycosyltransferase
VQAKFSRVLNKNFKLFEILDEDKIVAINDNQSFVILFDFSKGKTNIYYDRRIFRIGP